MTIPLLMLPGMMCDERLFSSQLDGLAELADMSFGSLTGAGSVSELARQVLATAPPKFALAGLSMGGIVAMEILSQASERVVGLALMDTNPLAERDEVKARRGPQIAKVQAGHLESVMREEMKPNYLTDGPKRAEILDLCLEMALDLGPDVFVHQSKALRDRPDQCTTLKTYRGPTLILCGREDTLCPPERHQLMAELMPHAELNIIENAGHLPVLEQPETTNAALRRWLEGM